MPSREINDSQRDMLSSLRHWCRVNDPNEEEGGKYVIQEFESSVERRNRNRLGRELQSKAKSERAKTLAGMTKAQKAFTRLQERLARKVSGSN